MLLVLVLFGGAIASGLFDTLTWTDAAVALAVLFIVRPLAGMVALLGSPHPLRDRALIAFLGIRGIGSFYYLAYGVNHGEFGDSERLWAVTGLIVLLSIILHGVTSTPLMRRLDQKAKRRTAREAAEGDVVG
jgi:NhaP-type Na+/H+ or K+/H+ antiporter